MPYEGPDREYVPQGIQLQSEEEALLALLEQLGVPTNILPSSGSSALADPVSAANAAIFSAPQMPTPKGQKPILDTLLEAAASQPIGGGQEAGATAPRPIQSWLSAGRSQTDRDVLKDLMVPKRGQVRYEIGPQDQMEPHHETPSGLLDSNRPESEREYSTGLDIANIPEGEEGTPANVSSVQSMLSSVKDALGFIPDAVSSAVRRFAESGLAGVTVGAIGDLLKKSQEIYEEKLRQLQEEGIPPQVAKNMIQEQQAEMFPPNQFEGSHGGREEPSTQPQTDTGLIGQGPAEAPPTPETQFGSANIDEMMTEITDMSQALHDSTISGLTSINDDFNEFINTSMSENKDLATQYDLWQEGSITALQNMANEYKQEMDSFGGRYDLLDEKYGNLADNMATLTSTHQAAMDRLIDPANRIGISGFGLEDFKLMPINTLAAASRHYGNMLSGLQSVGDVYGRQGGLLGEQAQGVSDKYSDLSNLLKAEIGTGLTGLGSQQDLMSGRQDLGMTGFDTNLQNLMTGYGAGRENLDTQRFPLETALQQQRDELAAQHGLQLASMTHPQKESTPWWQDVGIEYLKSDSGENLINTGLGLIKDWF